MASQQYTSEDMKRYFNDPEFRRSRMQQQRPIFRKRNLISLAAAFLVVALLTWYTIHIISGLPPLEKLENPKTELATKVYSADGIVIDQFFYKNRTRVTLDRLPPGLIK
ncbi:MAG: hypothetical protein MUF82_02735 [Bacteroidetes bacterium]|nr:hypothetical protein [Bacteroidota bacterium]